MEEQGGRGGAGKGDEGEGEGVVEEGAVAVFAPGKGADVFDNAAEEEEGEGEDGAHLDDDGVQDVYKRQALAVVLARKSNSRFGAKV